MDDKLYIKKFIRDDGEKLSFDGEQLYLAQENTLLARPDPSTTAVNFTEADGGEMIRQQNTTYDQPVNGLIIPKSTDYWTLTKQLSLFFKVNHTYKIIYVKKDGSMFKVSNAWISSGLQIVPVPHEEYSNWSITMTIGNVNWTEYAEDSQGDEIYSNTITLPLISAATGGEEWEYEEQEEISGEGSEITFNDTVDGAKITDLTLKGNTFQQTYSGKNLLDLANKTSGDNANDVSWVMTNNTAVGNGTCNGSYTATTSWMNTDIKAGTYTFSFEGSLDKGVQITFQDADGTNQINYNVSAGSTSKTFTLPSDKGKYRVVVLNASGYTFSNYTISKLQLEAGSTATSFEPYVGGTASPNLDYPQAINVVTGAQTVKLAGKNLFNGILELGIINGNTGQDQPNNNFVRSKDYIQVGESTIYTISSTNTSVTNILVYEYKADHSYNMASNRSVGNGDSFMTNSGTKYLRFRPGLQSTDTSMQFQLEKSSSPTTYQPYQSQSYTVDLGSTELCKIGDYQDYIYKSGDDWYVHKDIKKMVLKGTETWNVQNSGTSNFFYYTTNSAWALSTAGVSTHFTRTAITSSNTNVGFMLTNTNEFRFRPDFAELSVTDWKTWLGSNNTTVYYALATPTDTKITDNTLIGELETLYTANGYNNKTIITVSATSPNLPAILAVTLQNPPVTGEVWDEVGTVWELGSGGTQTVNIDSTTTVYPVWRVEGPCVNPTLQNNTTDTIAQYDGTVAAGQTLTVNFEEGTAYLDSALVTRYVSGLVSLRPGENTIGFNSDGGDTETSTISWNNVIN